jgi:hypothetical protein
MLVGYIRGNIMEKEEGIVMVGALLVRAANKGVMLNRAIPR